MRYCPTCGYKVGENQRFCPECSTKLTGASAPKTEPPADVSNAVPRRPGGGWGLQDDAGATDDLDDFFASYRRKADDRGAASAADDEPLPTRRSRRRFDPDLSYDNTPLPAAPQAEAPRPAVSGPSAAEQLPAVADAARDQGAMPELDPQLEATRPAPPPVRDEAPVAPLPAAAASTAAATADATPHWFDQLGEGIANAEQPTQAAAQGPAQHTAPHAGQQPAPQQPAPAQPARSNTDEAPTVQMAAIRPQHDQAPAAAPAVDAALAAGAAAGAATAAGSPQDPRANAVPEWIREASEREASTRQTPVAPQAVQPPASMPAPAAPPQPPMQPMQPGAGQWAAASQQPVPAGAQQAHPPAQPTGASDAPERPFDEVLTGREPGDETMDHPIISRDFERTGIVHVPRLDDGTPVAPSAPAPETGDAPWQAPQTGLNPAVAPLPERGGWPQAGAPSPFEPERGTGLGDLVRDERSAGAASQPGTAFGPAATAQNPVVGAQPTGQSFGGPNAGGSDAVEPGAAQPDAARSIFAEWFGDDEAAAQAAAPVAAAHPAPGAAAPARPPAAEGPGGLLDAPEATPGVAAGQPDDDEWADVLFGGGAAPQRTPARPPVDPSTPVDPAVERQRPWYEQGLDGTEETGQEPPAWAASRPGAPAVGDVRVAPGPRAQGVQSSAPSYSGPRAGTGTVGAGAAAFAGANGQASAAGPGGPGGPGGAGTPTGSGGDGGGGGIGGALRGLDRTGRRRLTTIIVAFVGAVLLIASAFLIGGVIGARDDDQAGPEQTTGETDPGQTEAETEQPSAPPPVIADPNFEAVSFQSESANLRCVISPEFGVACQHSNPAFAVPDDVCADTGTSGAVVGLDSNGYTYPCLTQDIPYGQQTLPMDTPIAAGEFTCRITLEFGVNCENGSGDAFGLEFELGISLAGRASETDAQTPFDLPEAAL